MIRNRFFSFVLFSSLILITAACDSDSTDPAPEQGGGAGGVAGAGGGGGSKGGEGGASGEAGSSSAGEAGESGAPGEKTASISQALASCTPSPQTHWTASGWYTTTHYNNCDANGRTLSLVGAASAYPTNSGGCICRAPDGQTHCGWINGITLPPGGSVQWTCKKNLVLQREGLDSPSSTDG